MNESEVQRAISGKDNPNIAIIKHDFNKGYEMGFKDGLQKLKAEIYEIKDYYGLYGKGVHYVFDAIDNHLKEVTQ